MPLTTDPPPATDPGLTSRALALDTALTAADGATPRYARPKPPPPRLAPPARPLTRTVAARPAQPRFAGPARSHPRADRSVRDREAHRTRASRPGQYWPHRAGKQLARP